MNAFHRLFHLGAALLVTCLLLGCGQTGPLQRPGVQEWRQMNQEQPLGFSEKNDL